MKFLLIGRGKMGKLIESTACAAGDEVVLSLGHDDLDRLGSMGKVADVVIDFSRPEALAEVASYVRRTGTPLLSGTTGYTAGQLEQLQAQADFMDRNVVFVEDDGSGLYHRYGCSRFAAKTFAVYSRKQAVAAGYTACPDCG